MESTIHRMHIKHPLEATEPIEWNGNPEDAQAAEAEFYKMMDTGLFIAYAVTTETETDPATGATGPVTAKRKITEFHPEAEDTWLVPQLQGG